MIARHDSQEGIVRVWKRHEPTDPRALRNAHRALGRALVALIGREMLVHHFVSRWVGPREPITLPFTRWVRSVDCGERRSMVPSEIDHSWAGWYLVRYGFRRHHLFFSLPPFPPLCSVQVRSPEDMVHPTGKRVHLEICVYHCLSGLS